MISRDPRDFPAAIEAIVREFGVEETGALIGKTGAIVRKWMNPDADHKPNIEQCVLLDAAMKARTDRCPITEAMIRKLEDVASGHEERPVLERFVGAVAALADAGATFRAAVDPAGPGGATITHSELCATLAAIGAAVDDLANMRRDVQAAWERQRARPVTIRGVAR